MKETTVSTKTGFAEYLGDMPYVYDAVRHTEAGTPYFVAPNVTMVARPSFSIANLTPFVNQFDASLSFSDYLFDPTHLPNGTALCKTAGQLCYLSLSPARTENANAAAYFSNVRSQAHGSILEHANFSFLLWGTSRSLTHELVRHRVGFAYSQVSQRYVSGKTLRFVERPEFQQDPSLHASFVARIDRAAAEYDQLSEALQWSMHDQLQQLPRTDRRKAVNQASRCLLPNETEAPIMVTGNVRAWRHFLEMRGSRFAEPEVRSLALRVYRCLRAQEPILFEDYVQQESPDGIPTLTTETMKV